VCKGAEVVTAKLVGTLADGSAAVSADTDTPAPYLIPETNDNACCLPEVDLDVTKLLCEPTAFEGSSVAGSCPDGQPFESSDAGSPNYQQQMDRLACLCCSGRIESVTEAGVTLFTCNPDDDVPQPGVVFNGDCANAV